jgi:hypothetical protein
MQNLQDALDRFKAAQVLTRELIAVYLGQFPSVRDLVIQQLIDNTHAVVDEYGQFFSPARRDALQQLINAAVAQGKVDDLNTVGANLNQIADGLQHEFDGLWDASEPLRAMASKLKFIFGDCAGTPSPHPLVTAQYFGDLPVASRIVQEGNDAALCGP